jgi:hypothetical protein
MPYSKHLTHGISNLVSLITKIKLGLSRECIHISQLHTKRDLDEWNHLLGMLKQKRVISKLMPGTIC